MSNPLNQYASTNGDVNLSSAVSVFSESNSSSFTRWVVLRFEIGDGVKDLASAADTVLTFEILRGGKFVASIEMTVLDAYDQCSKDSEPLTWKAGETIAVTLLSDQAGDTDVDVTVEAIDVAPLQPLTSGRTLDADANGEVIASNAGGGAGFTGARTVVVNVEDEAEDAVPYAMITVSLGGQYETVQADGNGSHTFSLDDDPAWTVAVTRPGKTHSPETFVVDGPETVVVTMTDLAITPSENPDETTGYWVIRNAGGAVVGQDVSVRLRKLVVDGQWPLDTTNTQTTDANGLVQFEGMPKGAQFWGWQGDDESRKVMFTVSATAGATVALPGLSPKANG